MSLKANTNADVDAGLDDIAFLNAIGEDEEERTNAENEEWVQPTNDKSQLRAVPGYNEPVETMTETATKVIATVLFIMFHVLRMVDFNIKCDWFESD